MEITTQRRKEIVNELLNGKNSIYNYDIRVDKNVFLNKQENDLVKEKLSKYFDIVDAGRDIFIKDIKTALKNAKKNYPEINKGMKDTIKKELSFINRNASFIALGGLAAGPAVMATMSVITPTVMAVTGAIALASGITGGMRLLEKTGIGMSDKMKAEFKALLNYEFELSTNSMLNSNDGSIKRNKPTF
jgi:hypothetical protein